MKIRNGFVSNSSSSSFTCDICGLTESGWDSSPKELGFHECAYNHMICDDDKLTASDKEIDQSIRQEYEQRLILLQKSNLECTWETKRKEKIQEQLKITRLLSLDDYQNIFDAHIAPAECPICSFVEFSYRDLSLFLKKEMKITHEEVLSEIKKVNGRRKKITDQEYCEYCLVKARKTSIEMFKEIKTQFNNYCAFNHYIKNQ